MIGCFLYYFSFVFVYFYITNHLFPLEAYHSAWNTLFGFFSPIAFPLILKWLGIIKPSPQKGDSPSPQANIYVPSASPPPDEELVDLDVDLPEPPSEAPMVSRQPTPDEMLHTVDLMDGAGFERWCAQLLHILGFSDIELTKASGDHGVDIIAVKDDVRYAFQCKRYSSDVGNRSIQEIHAGKSVYHCHVGIVVTNRHFTSGAKKLANATGTLLWDRDKLKSIIQKIQNKKNSSET